MIIIFVQVEMRVLQIHVLDVKLELNLTMIRMHVWLYEEIHIYIQLKNEMIIIPIMAMDVQKIE